MRARFGSLAVALVLGSAPAQAIPARAQAPTGPAARAVGGGPFMLSSPALQKELKLSKAQVDRVESTLQELARKHGGALEAARTLPPVERVTRQRRLLKAMNDEVKATLGFTAEQARRFDQI